ncbi:MAG TPA: alpha/beta hydrolase [Candidatus Agrococcus pullicola]|uniref:Alpha/beta hydrolase n=1 Tax=Candidatus Agrococcus pullicola TaxID=2838429 RepID=A0A9D1YXG8_9MICO|nr:alpha/beta hydrolase [Candidatus Agrococcus pullicola]
MERTIQKSIRVANSTWVSVDVYGEPNGAAVVIVPGVMSDAAEWAPVASALQGWPTVAVVNRRGRTPSGPLTSDYSLEAETDDLIEVLQQFPNARTVFGWSYGGLIVLSTANRIAIPHVISYEPVIRPFASHALAALEDAHVLQDWEKSVRIVTEQIAGMGTEDVDALLAAPDVRETLELLSQPVFAETAALNAAPTPAELARRATRVDLIVGERNRGLPPYGTSLEDVCRLVKSAQVHGLNNHGHMAHLEAPQELASLIDGLGAHAAQ